MHKKVLSEIALYYGDVAMPKDWDIDRDKLQEDILKSNVTESPFPFSRTWDMLNTYMCDHIRVKYNFNLIKKEMWGNIYKPGETTIPLLNIDPIDLRNSPDYTFLYGVKFIMFPSTCMYYLTNNQKDNLNFVHTITYEFI